MLTCQNYFNSGNQCFSEAGEDPRTPHSCGPTCGRGRPRGGLVGSIPPPAPAFEEEESVGAAVHQEFQVFKGGPASELWCEPLNGWLGLRDYHPPVLSRMCYSRFWQHAVAQGVASECPEIRYVGPFWCIKACVCKVLPGP